MTHHLTTNQSLIPYYTSLFRYPSPIHPLSFPPVIGNDVGQQRGVSSASTAASGKDDANADNGTPNSATSAAAAVSSSSSSSSSASSSPPLELLVPRFRSVKDAHIANVGLIDNLRELLIQGQQMTITGQNYGVEAQKGRPQGSDDRENASGVAYGASPSSSANDVNASSSSSSRTFQSALNRALARIYHLSEVYGTFSVSKRSRYEYSVSDEKCYLKVRWVPLYEEEMGKVESSSSSGVVGESSLDAATKTGASASVNSNNGMASSAAAADGSNTTIKLEDTMQDEEDPLAASVASLDVHGATKGRLVVQYYNPTHESEFYAADLTCCDEESHLSNQQQRHHSSHLPSDRFLSNMDLIFKKWYLLKKYDTAIIKEMEKYLRKEIGSKTDAASRCKDIRDTELQRLLKKASDAAAASQKLGGTATALSSQKEVQRGASQAMQQIFQTAPLDKNKVMTGTGIVRDLSDAMYINFYALRDEFMPHVHIQDAFSHQKSRVATESSHATQSPAQPHSYYTNIDHIFPYFSQPSISSRSQFAALLAITENGPFLKAHLARQVDQSLPFRFPLVHMLQLDRPLVIPFHAARNIVKYIFPDNQFPKASPNDYPSYEELILGNLPQTTGGKNCVESLIQVEDCPYNFNAILNSHDDSTVPAIEITHLYFIDPKQLANILQLLRMQLYENELFSKCFAYPRVVEEGNSGAKRRDNLSQEVRNRMRNVQVRVLEHNAMSINTTVKTGEGEKPCNIRVYLNVEELKCKVVIMVGNTEDESLQQEAAQLLNKYHNIPLLVHFVVKKYEK